MRFFSGIGSESLDELVDHQKQHKHKNKQEKRKPSVSIPSKEKKRQLRISEWIKSKPHTQYPDETLLFVGHLPPNSDDKRVIALLERIAGPIEIVGDIKIAKRADGRGCCAFIPLRDANSVRGVIRAVGRGRARIGERSLVVDVVRGGRTKNWLPVRLRGY